METLPVLCTKKEAKRRWAAARLLGVEHHARYKCQFVHCNLVGLPAHIRNSRSVLNRMVRRTVSVRVENNYVVLLGLVSGSSAVGFMFESVGVYRYIPNIPREVMEWWYSRDKFDEDGRRHDMVAAL